MFHRVFFAAVFLANYRMALHFLKLPVAASPGVMARAQELNSTITKRKTKIRVIIGRQFFYKSSFTLYIHLPEKRSKILVKVLVPLCGISQRNYPVPSVSRCFYAFSLAVRVKEFCATNLKRGAVSIPFPLVYPSSGPNCTLTPTEQPSYSYPTASLLRIPAAFTPPILRLYCACIRAEYRRPTPGLNTGATLPILALAWQ